MSFPPVEDSVSAFSDLNFQDECSHNYKPKLNLQDTSHLDKSAFSFMTKIASGELLSDRGRTLKDKNLAKFLSKRTVGSFSTNKFSLQLKRHISNNYIPTQASQLDRFNDKVFCGVFSKDGDRFLSASKDGPIRMYDSSNGSYKFIRSFRTQEVNWSIVDVNFSPDGKHFVYSTWSNAIYLYSTVGNNNSRQALYMANNNEMFCIFSVKFSADGKEILGGANDGSLYIYDLHRQEQTSIIRGNLYDINNVCFADDTSQIILSGGDEALVRVWDRRTFSENQPKPVGILAGHTDGVVYIDSRGDGRHLISNSKDQNIKLWDIRMFSNANAVLSSVRAAKSQDWDYRWHQVPNSVLDTPTLIKGDTSLMTYRGHMVLKTLIRCRFSPVQTTGQKFIYTGCCLGRVIIYDSLTGKIVQKLREHTSCVRDIDWHPRRNEIISSSWDGRIKKFTYEDDDAWLDDSYADLENSRRKKKKVQNATR